MVKRQEGVKGWEADIDLYGFLTTEPNAVVEPVHPKAMPVILATFGGIDVWMKSPWEKPDRDKDLCKTMSLLLRRGGNRRTAVDP